KTEKAGIGVSQLGRKAVVIHFEIRTGPRYTYNLINISDVLAYHVTEGKRRQPVTRRAAIELLDGRNTVNRRSLLMTVIEDGGVLPIEECDNTTRDACRKSEDVDHDEKPVLHHAAPGNKKVVSDHSGKVTTTRLKVWSTGCTAVPRNMPLQKHAPTPRGTICAAMKCSPANSTVYGITAARQDNRTARAEDILHQPGLSAIGVSRLRGLALNMKMFFDVFGHDFTIEKVDDAVRVVGIVRRVGNHDNRGPLFVQLRQ